MQDLAGHVRQPEVPPAVAIRQLSVVHPQKVQHGCVQVMRVDPLLHRPQTEVVRGADLLKSTARQLLLYRALGLRPPRFYHCPLRTDERGERLAKRHDPLSLRALRANGFQPEDLRTRWQ